MSDPGYDHLDTPERVDLAVDLAGIGSRSLAVVLDLLLATAAALVLVFAGALAFPVAGAWAFAAILIGFFLIQWFYFALFEGFWQGQTPGKRALGLRVRKVGGYPAGWSEALIRNFLRVVVDLALFMPIGLIVMLVTRRAQRVGDLAAGTVVVRERSKGIAALDEIGYADSSRPTDSGGPELTTDEFETLHAYLARCHVLDRASRDEIERELAALLRRRLSERGVAERSWMRLPDEPFLLHLDAAWRGEATGESFAPPAEEPE